MSSSPENAAEQTHTKPVSNLTYLHKHQPKSKPSKLHDSPHARGRNSSRHELGRRNRPGEKVTRIYPRQVYVTLSLFLSRLSDSRPASCVFGSCPTTMY